jgi:hypothetical protein
MSPHKAGDINWARDGMAMALGACRHSSVVSRQSSVVGRQSSVVDAEGARTFVDV